MQSTDPLSPGVHWGRQGKHIRGRQNFMAGRSELTHPNPQALLDRFVGSGVYHGGKEVIDFAEDIGVYVGQAEERQVTTRGTVHYDLRGNAHIVPARPAGFQ